jgi:hypothetical protein
LSFIARITAADSSDVFVGPGAGGTTTTGSYNTALGYYPLTKNTSGAYNTAIGSFALNLNTTGNGNSAYGYNALLSNTTLVSSTRQPALMPSSLPRPAL